MASSSRINSRGSSTGSLEWYSTVTGAAIRTFDATVGSTIDPNGAMQKRVRFTAAQVNAGAELLPAVAGYKNRITNIIAIAVGGTTAGFDSLDVMGTQTTSKILVSFALLAMGRSVVARPESANVTVLADGASFSAMDVNTAITVIKAGSALSGATHIDVIVRYALDAA